MTRHSIAPMGLILSLGLFTFACGGPAPSGEPATPPAVEEALPAATIPTPDPASADDPIQNAMSAGPSSISANATVMDWDLNVVREGSNDWTCLPDRPTTPGNDP